MSPYRVVMLAYPRSYRRAHGPEIVDTANELADGRWSALQSGALLVEGLRTRARLSTGGAARQAWASGLAFALALSHVVSLALVVMISFDDSVSVVGSRPWRDVLVVGLPLAGLTVTTRWPAALLVAAPTVIFLVAPQDGGAWSLPWSVVVVSQIPPVLIACMIAALGDGRRALSPTRAIGLLALIVGAGLVLSPVAAYDATGWFLVLALPVIGLALVAVDPRPLAAASAVGLIRAGSAASALVAPGFYAAGTGTFVIQTATMGGLALLGLAAAAVAGRRTLSVSR